MLHHTNRTCIEHMWYLCPAIYQLFFREMVTEIGRAISACILWVWARLQVFTFLVEPHGGLYWCWRLSRESRHEHLTDRGADSASSGLEWLLDFAELIPAWYHMDKFIGLTLGPSRSWTLAKVGENGRMSDGFGVDVAQFIKAAKLVRATQHVARARCASHRASSRWIVPFLKTRGRHHL